MCHNTCYSVQFLTYAFYSHPLYSSVSWSSSKTQVSTVVGPRYLPVRPRVPFVTHLDLRLQPVCSLNAPDDDELDDDSEESSRIARR
jgi:hypothetical protein